MPRRLLPIAILIVLALVGCREEEQERFRLYQPGVYQGQADQRLNVAQRQALSARLNRQADDGAGVSRIDKMVGDVRPPK
ncbi:MAG: hypothetical protein QF893_06405 [Alphaproteobacteria bacterium]|jgi:hypothetical protein|nr:hypothetical protein [Alphaproteobacteria bacterium]